MNDRPRLPPASSSPYTVVGLPFTSMVRLTTLSACGSSAAQARARGNAASASVDAVAVRNWRREAKADVIAGLPLDARLGSARAGRWQAYPDEERAKSM